jgi:very-long-chain (3R)-3-hydroxyacyl-CoA dehydratase
MADDIQAMKARLGIAFRLYLTFYNAELAVLWLWLAVSVLLYGARGADRYELFDGVEFTARWVQTITLVEVVHAAVGA